MMRGWTAMLDQLNLTDAQKKKIEAILENANKRMQELRQQMDAQQGSLREKFTQIREETQKQIEAVLTAEQKAKWQQLRQEMEQRMRERARERGEGGPGGSGGSSGGQGRTGSGGNQEGSGRGA
jgi:Spy/CpxP family protein refolding chaperone